MNKFVILNAVWLIVAAAAFFVGRSSESTSAGSAEQAERNGQGLSSRGGSARGSSGGSANDKEGGGQSGYGSSSSTGVTIAQYQRETDALMANKMFADLLLELRPENAREVFDALLEKSRNGEDTGQQMGLLLEAWGKIDGSAAIAAIADMDGDGRRRGFASISAMRGWASTDPEAAKAHLGSLENGFEKGMMTQGVVSGLAQSDPAEATEYVIALEAERDASGDERDNRWRGYALDRQMEAIANAQIQRGMNDATAWAESLPEGSIKSSAFDQVAESYANSDPQEAAEWVKSHADQEYAKRAIREISEELAREDPAAAMNWAGELPDEAQTGAVQTAMERWTREDPSAAGEYLQTMEASSSKDAAVSSFARSYDREDPALAAQWAQSIGDEQIRTETIESVAQSWMRSNPEEAKAWLPQSGLSAEDQTKVIENSARGGRGDFRGGRDR